MSRQWRSDDTSPWIYGFGDGSDGDLTISSNTTEAPIDASCSGTSGASTLSATNASFAGGQLILIHQTRGTGAGNWELNKIASYTSGTITLEHTLENTYTDSGASQAQVRVMRQYNNVTINSGVTWTAKAWDGNVGGILGFFAKGTVTVTGTIAGNGRGFRGGSAPSFNNANQGEGTGGAGTLSTAANGNGGGGTSGSGRGGAGGGHAVSGTTGGNGGNTGGSAVGDAELVSLNFGGAGAGSASSNSLSNGANGGGIVSIFANDLTITGAVNLSGANSTASNEASGGAGAGGSCLLKCKTATLGTTKITSTGQTPPSTAWSGGRGGASSVGRIHIDYSGSYTGSTNPTLSSRLDPTIKVGGLGGGAFLFNFV